jgi:hypothetical protein
VSYYADAEGGDHVPHPDHAALIRLTGELNTSDNTFFVVYPNDEDLEWSIAVLTRRGGLGGYDIERLDPASGQDDTTIAADPTTIATDVLNWITQR